ncbi:PREDICTED: transcription factor 25 isoform X2 [Nelumbo nucifera]|uniref:Transcription factor 25 isoform X2 n=1 Tax=Nelumbo nucifera TaxID=4432 RepID=A0A1U8QBG0_NELNU|nr:PREDICTED: transcription factor 25 isoform X2 [Nelumbo nucifera]
MLKIIDNYEYCIIMRIFNIRSVLEEAGSLHLEVFLEVDELEDADGTLTKDDEQEPSLVKSSVEVLQSFNHKSSRKNKKKKKKRSKEDQTSTAEKAKEPLDLTLETLSICRNPSFNQSGFMKAKTQNAKIGENAVKQCTLPLLMVDPKFLRAENELRRIFGSKVVNSFENSNNGGSLRQMRGGRRGSVNHRKTILVSPSAHWPRWDGSLSMEFLETKDGQHFFKYVHLSSYIQAQKAFEAAKATHDLNGIASILIYHPYHIESLLTIAEVLKFSGEHQSSADAIAKCLYALECAWNPLFNPLQGNCQLKYSLETNRPLFSVLFVHMQNMDRRGCHRSALEVCKLLLSLDSDDPMGAMFCIDYFALRAQEYAWLEKFSEAYQSGNSLWLFPNFSYSLAICRFYLEYEVSSKNTLLETEKATSTDLMKQALLLHPLVLKKLVAKAPLKDPAWTKILKHSFFGSAHAGSPSLDHLINIYVERNYIIWRFPDLQKLLRDAARLVIETLDSNGSDAKDWACVRKEAFPSEKNEYSHLLVSDFSDTVATMPPEDLRHLMIDPRMAEPVQNGDGIINIGGAAHAPREVMNRNPLVVFLESMLPWIDYGAANVDELDDHDRDDEN